MRAGRGTRVALALLLAPLGCASGPRSGTRLDSKHVYVELEAEYKRSRSGATADEQVLLSERLGAEIDGIIYHPRFLRVSLDGELAMTHAEFLNDGNGFATSLLPAYAAVLSFLPEHTFPITLFARRDEDRSIVPTSAFSSFLESRVEEYGGELGLRLKPITGRLSFRHSDFETQSFLVTRSEVRETAAAQFRHQSSGRSQTELKFRYDDVLESSDDRPYTSTWATLTNTIQVGDRGVGTDATLRTSVDFWDRNGTAAYQSFDFSEDIGIRLTDDLRSNTRYSYLEYEQTSTTHRHRVAETLIHSLFDSLTTSVEGRFITERIDDLDILSGGGSLEFAYRKETALGRLTAGYGFHYDRQDNSPGVVSIRVVDESHRLETGRLTLLRNLDIRRDTVIVTDSTRVFLYVEGIHYELIDRGRRTEIARIPGGGIPDGTSVLVDYQYVSPSDIRFDTRRQHIAVGLRLMDALELYARYDQVRQDLLRGTTGALEDLDAWLVGIDFSKGGLRALAEYEDHDSSSGSYRQVRGEVGYSGEIGRNWDAGLSVTALRTLFDEGGDLRVTTIQGTLRGNVPPRFSLLFEPSYRIERGRGSERDLFSLRLDLKYSIGELHMHLEVLHETGKYSGRDVGETFLSFILRRRW